MAIQKEFVLRYRNDGHLRFQIPVGLCEAEVARLLSDHISAIAGVYSVNLYRSQHKLAIRYHESVCDFDKLARLLFQMLAELEEQGCFEAIAGADSGRKRAIDKIKDNKVSRWFGEKYQAAKETVQAAKLLGKLGSQGPKALIRILKKPSSIF